MSDLFTFFKENYNNKNEIIGTRIIAIVENGGSHRKDETGIILDYRRLGYEKDSYYLYVKWDTEYPYIRTNEYSNPRNFFNNQLLLPRSKYIGYTSLPFVNLFYSKEEEKIFRDYPKEFHPILLKMNYIWKRQNYYKKYVLPKEKSNLI